MVEVKPSIRMMMRNERMCQAKRRRRRRRRSGGGGKNASKKESSLLTHANIHILLVAYYCPNKQ
jgi:hypothetical protein